MPFPDNSCQPGNPPSGYPPYSFLEQSGNGFDNQYPIPRQAALLAHSILRNRAIPVVCGKIRGHH